MAFEEVQSTMHSAELVVCHAGVGTIITALRAGKRPAVIPRRVNYGEHVDDHQLDIATQLADRELIHLVESASDLERVRRVEAADSSTRAIGQNPRLRRAIRVAVGEASST